MRLGLKISLFVLGILLISVSILSIPVYWFTRAALEQDLDDQLRLSSHLVSVQLDRDLLDILAAEPQLSAARDHFQTSLDQLCDAGLEGISIYDTDGQVLVRDAGVFPARDQLEGSLPGMMTLKSSAEVVVSEIFPLSDNEVVKAAAQPMTMGSGRELILVVWASARYLSVFQQMRGVLLWVFPGAILLSLTLALVFSGSLVRPVRALSRYAGSIRSNLYTPAVNLQRTDEIGELNRSLQDMQTELQKQEANDRRLLAGIAHEIKNPLGGMEIYSGLLQEELKHLPDDKAGELRGYLEKVTLEMGHLKRIVQEYLDFARPLKNVIEEVNIASILEAVEPLLRPQLDQKDQQLVWTGNATLEADRSKLQRVFMNLLQNAMEASAPGSKLRVNMRDAEDQLYLDVLDQGKGIPEEDWQRIFEPYYSTSDRGYGLGLSIVKAIIKEMNGTVLVHKSSTAGTCIRVSLPRGLKD